MSEQVLERKDAGCVPCDGIVTTVQERAAGTGSEGQRQWCLEYLLCVIRLGPFHNISNASDNCPEGRGGSPLYR